MVVFRIYFASSISENGFAVGTDVPAGVASGGTVPTRIGIFGLVNSATTLADEESKKMRRITRNGKYLFRMGLILPLVVKNKYL